MLPQAVPVISSASFSSSDNSTNCPKHRGPDQPVWPPLRSTRSSD